MKKITIFEKDVGVLTRNLPPPFSARIEALTEEDQLFVQRELTRLIKLSALLIVHSFTSKSRVEARKLLDEGLTDLSHRLIDLARKQ